MCWICDSLCEAFKQQPWLKVGQKKKKKKKLKGCWVTNVLIRAAFSLMYLRSVVFFIGANPKDDDKQTMWFNFFFLFCLSLFLFFVPEQKKTIKHKKSPEDIHHSRSVHDNSEQKVCVGFKATDANPFHLTQQQKRTKKVFVCFFLYRHWPTDWPTDWERLCLETPLLSSPGQYSCH